MLPENLLFGSVGTPPRLTRAWGPSSGQWRYERLRHSAALFQVSEASAKKTITHSRSHFWPWMVLLGWMTVARPVLELRGMDVATRVVLYLAGYRGKLILGVARSFQRAPSGASERATQALAVRTSFSACTWEVQRASAPLSSSRRHLQLRCGAVQCGAV